MQLLLKIIIVCKSKEQKRDKNTVGSIVIQSESSLVVSRGLKMSVWEFFGCFFLENHDGLKAFSLLNT